MSASQFPIFSVSVDRHVRWHQLEWRQPVYILLPGAALCTQLQGAPMDCVVCLQTLSPPPTPSTGKQSLRSARCGRWGPLPHGWELQPEGGWHSIRARLLPGGPAEGPPPPIRGQKIVLVLSQIFSFLP